MPPLVPAVVNQYVTFDTTVSSIQFLSWDVSKDLIPHLHVKYLNSCDMIEHINKVEHSPETLVWTDTGIYIFMISKSSLGFAYSFLKFPIIHFIRAESFFRESQQLVYQFCTVFCTTSSWCLRKTFLFHWLQFLSSRNSAWTSRCLYDNCFKLFMKTGKMQTSKVLSALKNKKTFWNLCVELAGIKNV